MWKESWLWRSSAFKRNTRTLGTQRTKRYTEPVVRKHRKKLEAATWSGEIYDLSYKVKESSRNTSSHPLDETGWTEVTPPELLAKQRRRKEKFIIEGEDEAELRMEAMVSAPQPPEIGAELLEIDTVRGHVRSKRRHRARRLWHDGKHGWQDAALDELIPSQYVWHVRDRNGPPLEAALKRFYGKASAIVCASRCENKPMMRLDIAIPTIEEVEVVVLDGYCQ
ncbi:hypothetical protein R1sor_017409 [Riccia sorocarpa]|uniref:Uncharacterized protein n=1 Tax=Riccia sorocarpa TaxID=122646 RepID=A0ABD3IAT2_9MARC